MTSRRYLPLLVFLLLSFLGTTQDLIINYTEPPDLVVCDSNTFHFALTNASPDTLFNVAVTVGMPIGLDYVAGSVTLGSEQNIIIANAPVFTFQPIPPFETVEFAINTQLKCPLVTSINSGVLFQNTINATWDGGTNSITTLPYVIETPLLVITSITNSISSGAQGDIIVRTITIQNTRLGDLSSFSFTDTHGGGIEISSNLGTVISSTATSFEMELNGNDFMTIGDGDGLFELNEVIVIREEVLILDCGFDVPSTNSLYAVSWGCYGSVCQTATQSALIDIIPSPENNPLVLIEGFTELPSDYCGGSTFTQGITITNEGTFDAVDLNIEIRVGVQGGMLSQTAFDPNSFMLDSSNVVTNVIPILSSQAPAWTCPIALDLYHIGTFQWATLAPGETMTLTWENYTCKEPDEDCTSAAPPMNYSFNYQNHCPLDSVTVGGGSYSAANFQSLAEQLLSDSVFYFFGLPIVDGSSNTLNYVLESTKLLESGVLNIEFMLPCGFSWGGSNLEMGGILPSNIDISTSSSGITTIDASYNLPMNSDSVMTSFNVGFDCDVTNCNPGGGCVEPYITAAGEVGCGSPSEIEIEVTLQADPSIPEDCGIKLCRTIELIVDCELDGIPIPLDGVILSYNVDFERCNFDEPDNDDNRLPDPFGDLNFNLVRKDRTIPGDTVTTVMNSVLAFPPNANPVIDVPVITVQFEAHTIDHGLDGGVALAFGLNKNLMAPGGIVPLSGTVRIFDASTSQHFECDVGIPFATVDTIYKRFEVVNTEPPQIIDELLYRMYKYNTSLSNMAGCLPPNFQYADGDSIILITKHRMVYNPKPQMDDLPPVVNLRAAVVPIFCDEDFNPFVSVLEPAHKHFQYSGYEYKIQPGEFYALPCEPFDEPGGMGVRFVLGMDNFFPFEYRPLASLKKWEISFPDGITMLPNPAPELIYLRYQQGDNIFSNEILNYSSNPPFLDFEVDDFHIPIVDEGWEMSFYYNFEADCSFPFFEASEFRAEFELNEGLPEPTPLVLLENYPNFPSAFPNINMGVTLANFTAFDNSARWSLVAINAASGQTLPAENSWIYPYSPSGLITNFQLENTTTGQIIMPVNGIFQLGSINPNQVLNFELIAVNNSCVTEVIQLHYGWNCTPYTSTGQEVCKDETIILTATSPNGELEMEVTSPISPFDLCDEIDYHTVEIFNAQLGNVYEIFMEAILPPGLSIVPNTSQVAYPTGSAFIDIPDPDPVAGNIFQWSVNQLNSTLQTAGLAGVSESPSNSVSIRFKTTTECGFVAGSQIIFTVKGKQNCDEATNNLSKAGDPIHITGISPTYTSDVNVAINSSTSISCDANVVLSVNILPDGITTNADSVLITLPPGVTYVPGSYNPGNNAPTNEPEVIDNAGQIILKLKLDAGIPASSLISFEIETTGFGIFGCADQVIQVLAVQRQESVCITTNELCYVLAATGSSSITISSEHPELGLPNLDITAYGDSVNYVLEISNSGITSTSPVQVDFYLDNDGNGLLSTGDVLVGSGIYNGMINENESVFLNGNIILSPEQLCNLIAVIDDENNCVCSTESVPVNFPINSILDPVTVCSGMEIDIGLSEITGHIYNWSPPGNIGCTNCPTTTFEGATNNTTDTMIFEYTLIDQSGNCEVFHNLDVNVLPIPGINQQDLEICAGETVTLQATPGGTYTWTGPGITDPNLATQELTLFENATFNVTINLPPGCDGMDEINITVLPFQESFSEMTTCPDDPVIIFNELVSDPGLYCDTISNVNGCDSLICIELFNHLSTTEEIIPICPGDSVEIDGVIYKEGAEISETFLSSFGCDSTHTIKIETTVAPLFTLSPDITIAQGDEVQIIATEGFASYQWSPTIGLSCTDCHNPFTTAELLETTEYTVTVRDENGCESQLVILVTVFPPCNSGRIEIPNVFTPDRDGVNDDFGVVDFEGFEMISSIKIFNRWGEKVFEKTGKDAKWDGTQKGKPAPSDVYVYVIKVICDEGEGVLYGDVTLLR